MQLGQGQGPRVLRALTSGTPPACYSSGGGSMHSEQISVTLPFPTPQQATELLAKSLQSASKSTAISTCGLGKHLLIHLPFSLHIFCLAHSGGAVQRRDLGNPRSGVNVTSSNGPPVQVVVNSRVAMHQHSWVVATCTGSGAAVSIQGLRQSARDRTRLFIGSLCKPEVNRKVRSLPHRFQLRSYLSRSRSRSRSRKCLEGQDL